MKCRGQCDDSLRSDVLALPIFKQEESSLPPENENKILPFQYVLCAATSPAVKLHDETLTYLNQGERNRRETPQTIRSAQKREDLGWRPRHVEFVSAIPWANRDNSWKVSLQTGGGGSLPGEEGYGCDPRKNTANVAEKGVKTPEKRRTHGDVPSSSSPQDSPTRSACWTTGRSGNCRRSTGSWSRCGERVGSPCPRAACRSTRGTALAPSGASFSVFSSPTVLGPVPRGPAKRRLLLGAAFIALVSPRSLRAPLPRPRRLGARPVSRSAPGADGFSPQSIFRVVFHDRRLQYTEHQQLEGWRWNRPGDRILDIGESPAASRPCFNVPSRLCALRDALGSSERYLVLPQSAARSPLFPCRYPDVRGHHRPASKPNAAQHGGVSVGPFEENVRLYPGKKGEAGKK